MTETDECHGVYLPSDGRTSLYRCTMLTAHVFSKLGELVRLG